MFPPHPANRRTEALAAMTQCVLPCCWQLMGRHLETQALSHLHCNKLLLQLPADGTGVSAFKPSPQVLSELHGSCVNGYLYLPGSGGNQ